MEATPSVLGTVAPVASAKRAHLGRSTNPAAGEGRCRGCNWCLLHTVVQEGLLKNILGLEAAPSILGTVAPVASAKGTRASATLVVPCGQCRSVGDIGRLEARVSIVIIGLRGAELFLDGVGSGRTGKLGAWQVVVAVHWDCGARSVVRGGEARGVGSARGRIRRNSLDSE